MQDVDQSKCGKTIGDNFYKQEFRKVLQAHSQALDGPWRTQELECSSTVLHVCEQAITPVDIMRVYSLTPDFDLTEYLYLSPLENVFHDKIVKSSVLGESNCYESVLPAPYNGG